MAEVEIAATCPEAAEATLAARVVARAAVRVVGAVGRVVRRGRAEFAEAWTGAEERLVASVRSSPRLALRSSA